MQAIVDDLLASGRRLRRTWWQLDRIARKQQALALGLQFLALVHRMTGPQATLLTDEVIWPLQELILHERRQQIEAN